MTKIHERVFAWLAVGIVLASAGALSVAVIIQQVMLNSQAASSAQSNTPPTTNTCTDTNSSEPTLAVPAKFLADNATTKLQVTDISLGKGPAAKAGDCLIVKYYGTLASDGTLFDENYTKPTAFAFTLGQGQVIQGWDLGLIGFKAGGVRRLVIPAAEAYGSQGSGTIPANSTLVFYVKLLRIQ